MKPYLAILKDSFREAFASRVLWILLGVATLLLAIAAGFGLEEHAGASFAKEDIYNPPVFYKNLTAQAQAPYPTAGKRIWSLVDENDKEELAQLAATPESNAFGNPLATQLSGLLNRLLPRRDLYDQASWSLVRLDSEARELVADGLNNMTDEQVARLNRLLIESAFPLDIAPSRERELYVSYWGSVLGTPLPLRRDVVLKTSLLFFTNLMVGMLGVFCGIIVTASIIPQTFDAGAIDLLLSKPIARPLLYLTKFLGGCAFTLITAVYILGGLWLLVGLRHDYWYPALLWCIPIFLFVFAVYYSVSALAGVIWRNTVVSVVVTILFWVVCWGVGNIKGFIIENFFFEPVRPIRVLQAGEDLVAANERGQIVRWNGEAERWDEILIPDEPRRWRPFSGGLPLAGPVYEPSQRRLIVVQKPTRRFAMLSSNVPLILGDRDENWRRREAGFVPNDASVLAWDDEQRLLVISAAGIQRQTSELTASQQRRLEILGFQLPTTFVANAGPLEFVLNARLTHPYSAAVNSQNGEVAIFNREALAVYVRNASGKYEERLRKEFGGITSANVAYAGDTVVLGTSSGQIKILNAKDLTLRSESTPVESVAPRFIEPSADGRWFALLLHDRTLWLNDTERDQLAEADVAGQGDISGVGFGIGDTLLVADRVSRVTEYRLPDLSIERQVETPPDWLEVLYRYLVVPIYTVFPKPTEINNLTTYLLTEQRTLAAGPRDGDLRTRHMKLNLWSPIWSNLAFLTVTLALGCLYTARKDF